MFDFDSSLCLDAASAPWPTLVRRVFYRLRVFGCVVLRNAVPTAPLDVLRSAALAEAGRQAAQFEEAGLVTGARQSTVGYLRPALMPAPIGSPDLYHYAIYHLFLPSIMPAIAGAYFKQFGYQTLTVPHHASHMRYQSPAVPSMFSGYHQDGNINKSMDDGRSVQFWIPFDTCGVDAPGMEFIPVGLNGVFPHADDINLSESFVNVFDQNMRFRPKLSPGDIVAFTSETIHRTWNAPEMTRPRTNIEFRVFAAGHVTRNMMSEGETRFFAPSIDEPAAKHVVFDRQLAPENV